MSDIGLTGDVADAAAGGEVSSEPVVPAGSEDSGNGINPAWNPMLEQLPTSLHHLVTPHLKQWDQNFNTQVQQVQQAYEPWKQLQDAQIDPQIAYGIMQLMESNPQMLVEKMTEYYGLNAGQGQQQQSTNPLDQLDLDGQIEPAQEFGDLTQHPEFVKLQLANQQLMQAFEQRAQEETMAKANQDIDNEINALKAKDPNLDVEALIMFAANTPNIQSMEDAFVKMNQYNQRLLESRATNFSPPVLAPTGGVGAAQVTDPAKLDNKGTKSLVVQILEAAAAQNNQP